MRAENQAQVVCRLNTAAGQLHAIGEMVEDGRPCEEVIHQLREVKAALQVTGTRLLACQIKQSEKIIIKGNVEARITELARLHKLYTLLVQQPEHKSEMNE